MFSLFLTIPATAPADTYRYDQHNRLYRVHDGFVNIQYEYDDAGNRIGISSNTDDYDFDGIPDAVEYEGCTDYMDADTDDDGISDGVEYAGYNLPTGLVSIRMRK